MPLDAPLSANGDLPVSVHRATLSEVIRRFGTGTPRRQLLAERLRRVYVAAVGTGHLHRFIVFGSFITSAPAPNDVDVFLLMDDAFDAAQVTGDATLVFDHAAAQATLGASVFWLRTLAALDGEDEAVAFWQVTRTGTRRGIVEIIVPQESGADDPDG